MTGRPATRPWRKYLRFGVRRLMVIVAVMCVWMGWIVRGAHIQRDAAAAMQKGGGSAGYSSAALSKRVQWWLLEHVPWEYRDYFETVDSAYVRNDAALEPAEDLHALVRLNARCSSVTDAGMLHVAGLARLSFLYLEKSNVSDAGLVHLKGLTNLSFLGLRRTRITDAGLEHLKGLTELKRLTISLKFMA